MVERAKPACFVGQFPKGERGAGGQGWDSLSDLPGLKDLPSGHDVAKASKEQGSLGLCWRYERSNKNNDVTSVARLSSPVVVSQ